MTELGRWVGLTGVTMVVGVASYFIHHDEPQNHPSANIRLKKWEPPIPAAATTVRETEVATTTAVVHGPATHKPPARHRAVTGALPSIVVSTEGELRFQAELASSAEKTYEQVKARIKQIP